LEFNQSEEKSISSLMNFALMIYCVKPVSDCRLRLSLD